MSRTTFDVVRNKRNMKWLVRADGELLMDSETYDDFAYDKKETAVEKGRKLGKQNPPSELKIKNKAGQTIETHKYD